MCNQVSNLNPSPSDYSIYSNNDNNNQTTDASTTQKLLSTEIEEVFRNEYEARLAKTSNPSSVNEYIHQIALLQLKELKQTLASAYRSLISYLAAEKGKALSAGISTLYQLANQELELPKREESGQDVRLIRNSSSPVVYKSLNAESEEEEGWVENLFSFVMPNGVVASFKIKRLELAYQRRDKRHECFGSIPNNPLILSYQWSEKENRVSSIHRMANKGYDLNKQASFLSDIQFSGVCFAQLNTTDEWGVFLASLDLETQMSFQSIMFSYQANQIYFIPKFTSETEKIYRKCEKSNFIFHVEMHGQVVERRMGFKYLKLAKSLGFTIKDYEILNPNPALDPSPSEIEMALQLPWQLITVAISQEDEYVEKSSDYQKLRDLGHVSVKCYVDDMRTIRDLKDHYSIEFLESIMECLSPVAHVKAIKTGEFQLVDLYEANLGPKWHWKPEHQYWREQIFLVNEHDEAKTFGELLDLYHQRQIHIMSPILIVTDSKTETDWTKASKLIDIPGLYESVTDIKSDLVLFDLDKSVKESNEILSQSWMNDQKKNEKNETIIEIIEGEETILPIRSVLLQLKWKDRPTDIEAVNFLQNSQEDAQIQAWVTGRDRILWRDWPSEIHEQLDEYLKPLLEKEEYTHSYWKRQDNYRSISDLAHAFAKNVSTIDPEGEEYDNQVALWHFLDQCLSYTMANETDTWETIAQRYHLDIVDLDEMNIGLELQPKMLVRIQNSLLSLEKDTFERRYKIAKELFPRLTWKQRDALFERQQRRRDYLNNYRELKSLDLQKISRQEWLDKLRDFVNQGSTPLTSAKRREYQKNLDVKWDGIERSYLSKHHFNILKDSEPTYFNFMKAMYPLLADAYELNQIVFASESAWSIGRKIGDYEYPLENLVVSCDQALKNGEGPQDFAIKIESFKARLKDVSREAFYGIWMTSCRTQKPAEGTAAKEISNENALPVDPKQNPEFVLLESD